MKFEIKHRFSGSMLFSVEADSWRLALEAAVKSRANLSGADLYRANLSGADLCGAKGVEPEQCTDLLMLLDQPGPIRAYKLFNSNGEGPYNGGIKYEIGEEYSVDDADTDVNRQCARGINLATLRWCLHEWQEGHRILVCEFAAKDIAAIPTATDGKFRVSRCKVIEEKDVSHIVAKPEKAEAA